MQTTLLAPLGRFFKQNGLFLLFFLIFASFYYDSVLDKGPLNNHLWRQTDCLSLTREYSRGAPFLEPQMNYQGADHFSTGKTAGEFPGLYYAVGKYWSIAGESFLSYRIFYLIILFFGLFAFYRATHLLFKDQVWAISLTALLFCSPVFVVYGVSFLTDVPAICFTLIALYFIVRYHIDGKKSWFMWAMLFFALSGLVKISALIAFVFLLFILFLETLGVRSLGKKKLFHKHFFEWMGVLLTLSLIFVWYSYAAHYNKVHDLKYTFNGIYPLWDPEEGGYAGLWQKISENTSYVFFSRYMIFLMGGLLVFHFFLVEKLPLFAYTSTILIFVGCGLYVLFWGPLLGVHDYYFAALLILYPAIVLPFVWYIRNRFPHTFSNWKLKSLLGAFVILNFIYCLSFVKLKTRAMEGEFAIVGNKELVGIMRWMNWDVQSNLYRFARMQPYLDSIGVRKEDRIISMPDPSFNTTLFLADRKGWTNYVTYKEKREIDTLIAHKARYLLISNPEVLTRPYLKPFLKDSIGNFEGVLIYKLSEKMIGEVPQ